ncbi:NmrA family NAD(P)-binding protein [Metapseudomonas resinovorans]|uniref:NmrA family NAD(P)-binding protein n=1 Tax=Metapseudomonas resinovorans TaxID=53412 RepID=UPI001F414F92|nr:NmrA family NAD(P)-binding protein [Pseudomonas resinovorans]
MCRTDKRDQEDKMITVMGATGHTGKRIVEQLLNAGESVRALGRSAERLAALKGAGADVMAGEPNDSAYLTEAFREADVVYTLLPYDPSVVDYMAQQAEVGEAIVKAICDSGVRRVVALSSVGAERASGNGPIASMHEQEVRLRELTGVDVLILRAGAFFENLLPALYMIEQHGLVADGVGADVPVPMIASKDIADAALAALLDRDWHGMQVRELLGQRDISYGEATRILGEHMGRPDLPYVQLPYDEMAGMLQEAGFSANLAELYAELAHGINERTVKSLEGRRPENTTATSFEAYVAEVVG